MPEKTLGVGAKAYECAVAGALMVQCRLGRVWGAEMRLEKLTTGASK